jgi:hypothetical protein
VVQEFPVLNGMEYISSRKKGGWRAGYYATASDIGIVEFNKWLEKYGGGRPDWEGGDPGPADLIPLDKLFSPYELHAKDCPICQKVGSGCTFLHHLDRELTFLKMPSPSQEEP